MTAPIFLFIPIIGLLGAVMISLNVWTGQSDLSKITFFGSPNSLPIWVDQLFLALMLLGLNASFLKKFAQKGLLLGTFALGALLVLDSSRLQPWSYFYLILLVVHLLPASRQFPASRQLIVTMTLYCIAGIYIWSGLFKINPNYFEIMFSWLVSPYYQLENQTLIRVLAVLSAVYQIAAGVLLLFTETRKIGAIAAILMHLLTLIMLGPFGLDWNPVIWPWHLTMIVLLGLIIRERKLSSFSEIKTNKFSMALLAIIWVLPAFNFLNLWDSHLSFETNSGNAKVAIIEVDPTEKHLLPKSMKVQADIVDLMEWHMDQKGVVLYPEKRVFVSLFKEICDSFNLIDSKFLIVGRRTLFERAPVEELKCKDL